MMQLPSSDHIKNSAGGSRNNMLSVVQLSDVLPEVGASNAGVALHVHVISQGKDNLLDLDGQLTSWWQTEHLCLSDCGVNALKDWDGECGGFTSTRLWLGNNISSL